MARTTVTFGFPQVQVFDGNSFSFSDEDRAELVAQAKRVTNDPTRITNFVEGLEWLSAYYYPWKKKPRAPSIAQTRAGLAAVAVLARKLYDHIKNDGAIGQDRGALNQLLIRTRHSSVDDIEAALIGLEAAARQRHVALGKVDPAISRRRRRSSAEVYDLAHSIAGQYLHHLGAIPTAYYKDGSEGGSNPERRGAFASILSLCVAVWRDRPAGKRRGGLTTEQMRGPVLEVVAKAKARPAPRQKD